MHLNFIGNACNVIEFDGVKLLTDPWLTDGAFYGSWFHYPPLQHTPRDFADVDGIYISHAHPDHYCPSSLRAIGADKPMLILKREKNILKQIMLRDGFTNIIEFEPGVTTEWKSMKLTMFDAFVGNNFVETEFGNPLDSALVIQCGDESVFNANDNTPDIKACHMLRERFGKFTIAQLNYNAAGPYPSCFINLSDVEKDAEDHRILKRNLDYMIECAKILDPYKVQPFAGAYIIGGKNWKKNQYLGTTTSHEAWKYLNKRGVRAIDPTGPLDEDEQIPYIAGISKSKYDYEDDPMPEWAELKTWMDTAALQFMWRAQKLDKTTELPVASSVLEDSVILRFKDITCILDPRLMARILKREAHWNNAEIGCHIEFDRRPNVYNYDFHMLMSYFHL